MATINDITPIGNKVRYTVYSVENNMFLGKEKSYDIKEKNITAIAEDINVTDMGPLTTDGENYIFTPIYISDEGIEYDDYIYTTNIVSGKSERLFKRASKDIMNYSDDKYIYIDNILSFDYENEDYSDFTRTITVYDKKGNKIDCIDVTGVDEYSYFIGGDERYMFVRGEDIEGAYIKYIDKSKIGTGNAKLETLFEIERKYLDTTVRRKLD